MSDTVNTSNSSQNWDAAQYADNARFVSDLGAPVLDLLAPKPGQRVLDIGCGDGALTARIVAAGAEVLAIDHSDSQIKAAIKIGLDAHRMDALDLTFEAEFDAVFSNAVLHWIQPPAQGVANVARALKPGGRFVGEFGGAGNVEKIKMALIEALDARGLHGEGANPWYFPTAEAYSKLLADHGFNVESAELIPRPTPLPGRMADWIKTLAQDFVNPVPVAEQDDFLKGVEEKLSSELLNDKGIWSADYVRLRFAATLDAG